MQRIRTTLRYNFTAGVRAACVAAALMSLSGCVVGEQKPQEKAPSIEQPTSLPTIPVEAPHQSEQAEIQETTSPPGSGQTAWAPGFEGELILGLDGQLYVAYSAPMIMQVQSVMKKRGLYSGPINGILDPPTMESILSFQEATKNLLRCGVPTPITRKLLQQGSHTDIASG